MTATRTAHPDPNNLAAFARGRLTALEATAVERHIEGCDACGALLDGLHPDTFASALRHAAQHSPPASVAQDPPTRADRTEVATREVPVVARYEVLEEIATGGMGVVYKARQPGLNRTVAVKMVLGDHRPGRTEVLRFLVEAEAVAAIDHPHVVRVYESGESDGRPYLVMEYLPGGTLARRLRDRVRLAPPEAAALLAKVARGVQAAHDAGIVHRDLKPGNVLFDDRGEPKVADFGLAKRAGSDLTRTGAVLGTPAYVAPEVADGRAKLAGPAADVWALGVILYQCLTGELPFDGPDPWAVLSAVANRNPRLPRTLVRAVPRDLEVVCLKCLAKDPRDRYESAAALADDLNRFGDGKPVLARPVGPVRSGVKWARRHPAVAGLLLAVAVVSLAGFGLVFAQWVRAEAATKLATDRADGEEKARQKVEDQKEELQAALDAAEDARRKAAEKQKELQAALDSADRNLSYHQIALADRYLQAGDAVRADRYLDACPSHLRRWEWFHLKRLGHREVVRLPDGGQARYSPDGKSIATLQLGSVRVYDAATGVARHHWPLKKLPENHHYRGADLAYSPDGKTLVVAGSIFRDRSLAALQPAGVIAPEQGDYETFVAVLSTADGAEQTRWALPLKSDMQFDCRPTFSRDGARLAVATSYYTSNGVTGTWVYESASGKLVKHLKDAGFHAAFTPDGKRLAYTARVQPALERNVLYDNLARVWDLDADKEWFTVREKLNPCTGPHAFSPDGKLLYSKHCYDLIVREGDTGREVRRFTNALGNTMALNPDGKSIATDAGAAVKTLDALTGERRAWFPGAPSGIAHVAFDPTGRFVIGGGWVNAPALVWDVGQSPAGFALPGSPSNALAQSLSPGGTLLATRRENARNEAKIIDPVIEIADRATGTVRHRLNVRNTGLLNDAHDWYLLNSSPMAFSGDNRLFVAAATNSEVRVWDVATGKVVTTYRGHKKVVTDLAVTPDGKRVATFGRDGTVRLWEAETGKELATFAGEFSHRSRIVLSPDGKRLAVAGQNEQFFGYVRVWNLDDKGTLEVRDDEVSTVFGVAFSPDGKRIATLNHSGKVRIYDAATGKKVSELPGQSSATRQLAFSPDGSRLAVLGYRTIELWDPTTGQELLTLTGVPDGAGYSGLFFSRDGHRLYYQNQGPIRCWDATPSEIVLPALK